MKDLFKYLEKERELMSSVQSSIKLDRPVDGDYILSAISKIKFNNFNGSLDQNGDVRGKLFLKPVGKERDNQIEALCNSEFIKSIEKTVSHDSSDCILVNLSEDGKKYVEKVSLKVISHYDNKPQFKHDSNNHSFLGDIITEKGMDADVWYSEKFDKIIIRFGDNPDDNMVTDTSVARDISVKRYIAAIDLLDKDLFLGKEVNRYYNSEPELLRENKPSSIGKTLGVRN